MSTDCQLVLCTAPEESAILLAEKIVELKLAACVNVINGVRSVYSWQGEKQQSAEAMLHIKTTRDALDALFSMLQDEHPYDIPELIALPIQDGTDGYLNWIRGEVKPYIKLRDD